MSLLKSNGIYSVPGRVGTSVLRVKTMVGVLPSNKDRCFGSVKSLSMTMRRGFFPYQLRVVSEGLSNKAVFLPTNIPVCSALRLCTSMEESGDENIYGCPPVRFKSMKPSADSAHFKVMNGR